MKRFTINRGRHYCVNWWRKIFSLRWNHNKWKLGFTIPKTNWTTYIPGETINKLFGVGFAFDHHANSWRLGWKYNFEKEGIFELYAYGYDETGTHIDKLLGEVEGDKYYEGIVESLDNKYWFTFLGIGDMEYLPNNNKDCKLQWDLYPYHGGYNTAPKKEIFNINYKPL